MASSGDLCSNCARGWLSDEFIGILEPMPDYSKLPEFHYKNVFHTSHNNDDGSSRTVDYFLPRANIVQHFEKGLLSLDNEEAIEKFSSKFIVEQIYIREYLQHLLNLRRSKEIRENERQRVKANATEKQYKYHNWSLLITSKEKMNKLRVFELD